VRTTDAHVGPSAPLLRVGYEELHGGLRDVLVGLGMAPARAELSARLFADASRDGVASHGLNRFPRFVAMIRDGVVDVDAEPVPVAAHGGLERWDGCRGPGNLNAHVCMARAIGLAREHGLGAVALANTNHWMRGGSYGWQAAESGVIGICWTNTLANLPAWGASEPHLGNNPLVIAVPRAAGHVVLDMALSQFSVGAIAGYRARGEELPVAGGFDEAGELTRDPAAIESSGRLLPIGFWKGAGLALLLDMVGVMLSGGRATHEISRVPERETGLSQVFLALDPSLVADPDVADMTLERIVADLHASDVPGARVRHPGERTLETRRRSLAEGVPVDAAVWRAVRSLM
jgi:3-dehydro-L-gulonate 2-dehydrogenase